MRISKHLHSCLLIEEEGKSLLIDPGSFTSDENALDVNKLQKLDYILITHEHPDHFHLPLIKTIVAKFPHVAIISNTSVVTLLQKEAIKATSEGNAFVTVAKIPHEQLWDRKPPMHVIFTVNNTLTHVGDSHHFTRTSDILGLPIQAPWGSTTHAVNLALKLKPRVIIPIHDWMWKDDFRKAMYQRLQAFFKEKGIDFKTPETGEIMTV